MTGQQVAEPPLEQAEFETNDVDCELARATIRQVLTDFSGVRDVQFLGGRALVTYSPFSVTKEEICTAIRQIGYPAMLKDPTRIRIREKRKTTLRIL